MQITITAKPLSALKTAIDARVHRGDWSVALLTVNSNLDFFAVGKPSPGLPELLKAKN